MKPKRYIVSFMVMVGSDDLEDRTIDEMEDVLFDDLEPEICQLVEQEGYTMGMLDVRKTRKIRL